MTLTRRGLFSTLLGEEPGPQRVWTEIDPRELFRRRHFPDVQLVTHEGKKVRLYEDLVKGRRVLFNMVYADCRNICIPVTANLARVQKMLGRRVGRDIFFYSVSIDPAHDTPAVLKEFAERHRVKPGWQFLTGAPADIEKVRRGLGFTYSDPSEDADRTNHVGMLRFGDEALLRWAAMPGQANPQHIVRTLKAEFGWS